MQSVSSDPGKFFFEQSQMRSHLQKCLEEGKTTMFPFRKTRQVAATKVKSTDHFRVYCSCRMLDLPGKSWTECSSARNGSTWTVLWYPSKH